MQGPGWVERLVRRVVGAWGYRSRFVETSVGPIHLLSADGRGPLPPVILVHGFGADASQWVPLARALRRRVRAILAIDLPGHGFSQRSDELTLERVRDGVIEAFDQIHPALGPSLVVGNSLGGAVALRYVQARPERAVGAHLLSPGGAPMTPAELAEVQQIFRVGTHREALAFLDRLYGRRVGIVAHGMAPLVRRVFRDPALHALLERVTTADWLTPDEIRTVPRPVRIVWGRQDRILPSNAVSFWRAHLPEGGELHEPDAFGHAPHLASPAEAAADVIAFLERCAMA